MCARVCVCVYTGANVDSDVDLLDDALDAVLDAKLGGYDNVQDDFGSDMEVRG